VSAQGNDRRPTKAERKEQARVEREQIQRKQAARKRNRVVVIVVGIAMAAVVVGALVLFGGGDTGGPGASATQLPGIMQTAPPWSNNTDQLAGRLQQLGLPGLSETILHHHIRVWVYVDGNPVVVPGNIGLSQTVASPIHTHDTTGTVHVESDDPNFQAVLGQFMDVWGLYFTSTCLGDQCNQGDRQLRVFVDGQPYVGDPTLLPLNDQSAIVITFGTQDQLPNPMPNTFTFNAGS
jgi:hypothetical protein